MSVRKKEKLFEKFLPQTNNLVDISIWSGFKSWVSRWWERCEVDNYHIYQSGIHLFEKVLWFLGKSLRTFPLNLPNFWNFSCLLKNLKKLLRIIRSIIILWIINNVQQSLLELTIHSQKAFYEFQLRFSCVSLKNSVTIES